MYKKILLLAFAMPLFFSCKEESILPRPETNELIEVLTYSIWNPNGLRHIVVTLPDGSVTKEITTLHEPFLGYYNTNICIGKDGRSLLLANDVYYKLFLYDIPTLRVIDEIDVKSGYGYHTGLCNVGFMNGMSEIYGSGVDTRYSILILDREMGYITPIYYNERISPNSMTIAGDESCFIFATYEEDDNDNYRLIKSIDTQGKHEKTILSLPYKYGQNIMFISEIPGTDRFFYIYDYETEGGEQHLVRVVLTDLANSFETVLEESDFNEFRFYNDGYNVLDASRDGKMLTYCYYDETENIYAVMVKHYGNDQLESEMLLPVEEHYRYSSTPSFNMISKEVFDMLPVFETPEPVKTDKTNK